MATEVAGDVARCSRQLRPIEAGASPPVALIVGRTASSERYKGHDEVLDAWPSILP